MPKKVRRLRPYKIIVWMTMSEHKAMHDWYDTQDLEINFADMVLQYAFEMINQKQRILFEKSLDGEILNWVKTHGSITKAEADMLRTKVMNSDVLYRIPSAD